MCDSCVETLLNELDLMDSELHSMELKLQRFSNSSTALAALRKLEDAINATKVANKYLSHLYICCQIFIPLSFRDFIIPGVSHEV